MSDGSGEFWWQRNRNRNSGSGLGGMLRHEGRQRQMERRVIAHTDGRTETIETITEKDYRTEFFSAKTNAQYRMGAGAFERLSAPMAQQNTPLHQLSNMKNDIMRELEQRLQPQQQNVHRLKGQG